VAEINTLYLAAEVINQALNQGSWNDAQLTTISTELSEFRLLRQYLPALRLERAALFSTSTVDYLKDKSLEGRNGFSRGWPKSFKLALFHLRPRGWESEDKAVFLVIIQRMIDSLGDGEQLYSTEIWDEVQRKNNLHGWESTRTPITFLAIGAWDWTVKSICQTQTRLNALSAACAVERFKLANHQLPASLDDLVPSLLPFVPKDPMTGAPLIYKRVQGMAVSDGQHSARTAEALLGKGESKSTPPSTDDSFVIYGLGWNRKDDGGPKVSFNASPEYQSDWGVIVTPTK